MADYIYLLENRLSAAQQRALGTIRKVARAQELTVFLTGGAVRDLTGGGSVRDLDVTVQGDASRLKSEIENEGGTLMGEYAPTQSFYFQFSGGVRAEVGSALSATYPKPGKPVFEPASISDDLRRRDFTANAMALSLNDGSYGLLMDPLNGTADIENRELRLVSNYGFIEDPSRLIRATRLIARLGWQMEERTRSRYDTAKEEEYISALGPWNRGYELEEIFYEEDPLRVLRALETEGWMQALSPALSAAKVSATVLDELRDRQGQLQTQGIVAPIAALAFPLLVAKLAPKDLDSLKTSFARPGFVREIESLEGETRQMQARFASKEAAAPSQVWKMLHSTEPALVLSMAYSAKGGAVQTRLKTFLTESPSARQKIPYALLQEMRITPDLPVYAELLDKLFFELMDNRLQTTEEMKAYLAPYSPPAPPPPVNLRRARTKKEARPSRAKGKKAAATDGELTVVQQEEQAGVETGLLEPGELTEVDQGTSPSVPEALAGVVAPLPKLAKNQGDSTPEPPRVAEPTAAEVSQKPAKRAPGEGSASSASGKVPVLAAKPAPMPAKEAARLTPHPIAAKEIAAKPSSMLPGAGRLVKRDDAGTPGDGKAGEEKTAKPTSRRPETPSSSAGKRSVAGASRKTSPKAQADALKRSSSSAVPARKGAGAAKQAATAKRTVPAKTKIASRPAAGKKSSPSRSVALAKSPAKKSSPGKPTKVASTTKVVLTSKKVSGKATAAGKKTVGKKAVAGKSTVASKKTIKGKRG